MALIKISLHRIKQDESSSLWKVLQEYLVELLNTIGNPEEKNLDEPIPYPYFGSYWEDANRFPLWGINEEGEKVGFVLLRDTGSHYSIAEFYIFPDQRQKGYGRAQLESVVAYCQKQKRHKLLYANCFDKNVKGYAFWTANEFYAIALEESPEGRSHILQRDL